MGGNIVWVAGVRGLLYFGAAATIWRKRVSAGSGVGEVLTELQVGEGGIRRSARSDLPISLGAVCDGGREAKSM